MENFVAYLSNSGTRDTIDIRQRQVQVFYVSIVSLILMSSPYVIHK